MFGPLAEAFADLSTTIIQNVSAHLPSINSETAQLFFVPANNTSVAYTYESAEILTRRSSIEWGSNVDLRPKKVDTP
ncbi:unnamed protein product [Toxocara canis]|uniref:Uncharacterized protein n=2 Tax=Toxocara canis TaxID=6265 RepID=A0A183UE14_TOXCA|nr:unnamed protein product [Toxocara canis]